MVGLPSGGGAMTPSSYPLCWPDHVKRARFRKGSAFKKRRSMRECEAEITRELKLMGATQIVVSSNCRDLGVVGQIDDPGVAVFFRRRNDAHVIALDTYHTASENAFAIAVTIESMRRIERHGSSLLADQAFSAFKALPSAADAPKVRHWRDVLGVPDGIDRAAQLDLAEYRYKRSVSTAHPDRGGTAEAMQELNGAIARAREALR